MLAYRIAIQLLYTRFISLLRTARLRRQEHTLRWKSAGLVRSELFELRTEASIHSPIITSRGGLVARPPFDFRLWAHGAF